MKNQFFAVFFIFFLLSGCSGIPDRESLTSFLENNYWHLKKSALEGGKPEWFQDYVNEKASCLRKANAEDVDWAEINDLIEMSPSTIKDPIARKEDPLKSKLLAYEKWKNSMDQDCQLKLAKLYTDISFLTIKIKGL